MCNLTTLNTAAIFNHSLPVFSMHVNHVKETMLEISHPAFCTYRGLALASVPALITGVELSELIG